jgi:endonuclease YncB( thermonuclease family)
MVTAGFAVDFERYSRGHYSDAQEAAQSSSRGNWNFSWQYPSNFRSCLRSRGGNVTSCSQQ